MSDSVPTRLYDFCRGLPGVTEDVKWDNDLVFSVGDKMFCVFALPDGERMSLKVDPMAFESWTRRKGIEPAPYLARHSWISLAIRGVLAPEAIEALMEDSHTLVAERLSRKKRRRYDQKLWMEGLRGAA